MSRGPNEFTVTCVVCPVGCEVTVSDAGEVGGNKCDRGREYALLERYDPRRVLTFTVRTTCPDHPLLPVKTDRPIPKRFLLEAVKLLAAKYVSPPVKAGDVVVRDILGTGASVVATDDLL
ncbi:MAG: DUF1667 domain-containing protein [Betaproteobacteria bacterium]